MDKAEVKKVFDKNYKYNQDKVRKLHDLIDESINHMPIEYEKLESIEIIILADFLDSRDPKTNEPCYYADKIKI